MRKKSLIAAEKCNKVSEAIELEATANNTEPHATKITDVFPPKHSVSFADAAN